LNLNAVNGYKVLVIGDAIYDHYVFVSALGKSIKESVLSVRHVTEETYGGGVWAAAAHLATFCAKVDVYHGDRVMINTRFLEEVYNRKLFTMHCLKEKPADALPDIPDYDLVIVTDFGHGTMSKEMIKKVITEAKFLAVNTQTNSTNFGFNLITKYPQADYVVVDELEARLASRDRDSPIEDVIRKIGYKKIAVTLGAHGSVGFDGEFHYEKAIDNRVVDTMGAGDAFLCVTAPFAAAGFGMQDLLKIGNAAGAIKMGILGHRGSVTKQALEEQLA